MSYGNNAHLDDCLKEKISALIDDELAPEEKLALLAKLNQDENLRKTWESYYLIKTILQSKGNKLLRSSLRISAKVHNELEERTLSEDMQSPVIVHKNSSSSQEQSSQG